jgi:hypothetical protein
VDDQAEFCRDFVAAWWVHCATSMKLGCLCMGLVLTGALLTTATEARADDDVAPPLVRQTNGAYKAGVALTATGASFLGTSAVVTAGTLLLVFTSNSSGPEGGLGALVALAFGGMIAGGTAVIGIATLVPGLVLMGNNKPLRIPEGDWVRDAHATVPVPGFTSVPILSGRF